MTLQIKQELINMYPNISESELSDVEQRLLKFYFCLIGDEILNNLPIPANDNTPSLFQ